MRELLHMGWRGDLSFERTSSGVTIRNPTDRTNTASLALWRPVRKPHTKLEVRFSGDAGKAQVGLVVTVGRKRHSPVPLGSRSHFPVSDSQPVHLELELSAGEEATITELALEGRTESQPLFSAEELAPLALITPSFPSSANKYLAAFVFARVKAYRAAGLNPSVLCSSSIVDAESSYEFDGIRVYRLPPRTLRAVLERRRFDKLLVHFLDRSLAVSLDQSFTNRATPMIVWCHGSETLFKDMVRESRLYFTPDPGPEAGRQPDLQALEESIAAFEARSHVEWVFVSEWHRERARALLGLQFHRSRVIHNPVNEKLFALSERAGQALHRVLLVRRFDNERNYSIDVAVGAIRRLLRDPAAKGLDFRLVGDGNFYDELVAPLRGEPRVTFHRGFLTHKELAEEFGQAAYALFPTRIDSQGVAACEAAACGTLPLSSDAGAVSEFLPAELLTPPGDAEALADRLLHFVITPGARQRAVERASSRVLLQCAQSRCIAAELDVIRAPPVAPAPVPLGRPPLLSVAVPVYNMESWLERCVASLTDGDRHGRLEVLVVDDGSTDGSLAVAKQLEHRCPAQVRVFTKANAGHGSAINLALEHAKGRYFRVVDADDWVDSFALGQLLGALDGETADVVFTDYSEDHSLTELVRKDIYDNIEPGRLLDLEMLCYEGYGFRGWGPVLASASIATERLRQVNHPLLERCSYVDVVFNALMVCCADTARYLALDIYRYVVGREDQTIAQATYMKKWEDHQRVLREVVALASQPTLSRHKREFLIRSLIVPMVELQFLILGDWLGDTAQFARFERFVAELPLLKGRVLSHPPPTPQRRIGRMLKDYGKSALPLRFVKSLTPHLLKDPKAAGKLVAEYVLPSAALEVLRDATPELKALAFESRGAARRFLDRHRGD